MNQHRWPGQGQRALQQAGALSASSKSGTSGKALRLIAAQARASAASVAVDEHHARASVSQGLALAKPTPDAAPVTAATCRAVLGPE